MSAAALTAVLWVLGAAAAPDKPPKPVERVLQTDMGIAQLSDEKMKWFLDAKFGMFIHWGLYSGAGQGERTMENQGHPSRDLPQVLFSGQRRCLPRPAHGQRLKVVKVYDVYIARPAFHVPCENAPLLFDSEFEGLVVNDELTQAKSIYWSRWCWEPVTKLVAEASISVVASDFPAGEKPELKAPTKTPVGTDRRAVRRSSSRNGGAPGGRALPWNCSVGRFVRRSYVAAAGKSGFWGRFKDQLPAAKKPALSIGFHPTAEYVSGDRRLVRLTSRRWACSTFAFGRGAWTTVWLVRRA